jgi:hypothetical protein
VERGEVFERRDDRRREPDPVNREHRAGHGMDRRWWLRGVTVERAAVRRLNRTGRHLSQLLRHRVCDRRPNTLKGRQGRPLIVEWPERIVEEDRVPWRRHCPWSGSAIRLPNEPFGMKSCAGKRRS